MAEEDQDGFGGLFDGASASDDDDSGGEETGPALVEEEYTRTPPKGSAEGRGALPPRPSTLKLSLVNSRHSLWGHRLWNAALLLADMVDKDEFDVRGKRVLELGAGAGLPALICALKGATKVVISDYATSTDAALMVPIQINIDRVQPEFVPEGTLHAVGHVWGQAVEDLLVPLRTGSSLSLRHENGGGSSSDGEKNASLGSGAADSGREKNANLGGAAAGAPVQDTGTEEEVASVHGQGEGSPRSCHRARPIGGGGGDGEGFDVVIMADLLFNRSQHAQLLETCDRCLLGRGSGSTATAAAAAAAAATVWVSFSHHDPEKAELDMKFFELAKEKGFVATRIKTVQMRDLFVENDGLDDLRGQVHLWCLKRR
ncbi:conserved unknown protein [Ectocarpus siliculosus]|uniref:Nicotinamide N-methyltransferase n=1 Tax=Ectocarpus siliculosus TaxID=2880 RepID=D7FPM1_ECTSI|nr:conserved unknown protein [Ectocarpus siliculosus]|eukprot:CBJ30478.1 conserved unknown protein [Ectocarpus siliculosus]